MIAAAAKADHDCSAAARRSNAKQPTIPRFPRGYRSAGREPCDPRPARIVGHYGLAGDIARQRSQTLEAARQQHPTRSATTHDPKILELPESAWINEPRNEDPAA